MIYVCVPVHNEAKTAGLVLWKVRQVFTAFQREYQLLVCDDGSTDGTGEVLARYSRVLPLSIITHRERHGYARSLEELLRLALERTDRPKRDCAITLPGDFVYSPDAMDDMVKRIESGSDLVVAEQVAGVGARPRAHRFVRRWTPRLLRVRGVRDSVSGFLALRLITLRQALRPLAAQQDSSAHAVATPAVASSTAVATTSPAPQPVPFPIGERMVYSAKYGPFSVGEATMEVAGTDTIRGTEMVHILFHLKGGALWYHLDQTLESWVGRKDFRSRRYVTQTEERGKKRNNTFDIFPDSGFYREAGVDSAKPTVADPLDDPAFLYWLRTIPLEV